MDEPVTPTDEYTPALHSVQLHFRTGKEAFFRVTPEVHAQMAADFMEQVRGRNIQSQGYPIQLPFTQRETLFALNWSDVLYMA